MSSFYEDASLVMIPSGYKTSKVYCAKPTDGTGDLTFTRSNDTATRVASNGLIEKVRTNLVLQSNTFNTTWTTTTASVTSGQAGYDGTNNAWLLTKSGASGRVNQSFNATAGLTTFSVYAKANASSYIAIEFSTSFIYVNLTNGAQGSIGAGTYKIESIGSGWYRISMTTGAVSSVFRIYPAENNDLAATSGSIFIQNAQIETGDIATDYIATTTAAVSVGPVANVPRLDYLNSTCPRLLLEPQRTNLAQYSEQFDNAGWTKSAATITANAVTSPDGYTNADSFLPTATTSAHSVDPATILDLLGVVGTFSVFAKYNGYHLSLSIAGTSSNWTGCVFDLQNGIARTPQNLGAQAVCTSKIEDYGNGWYRCSITYTPYTSGTFYNYIGAASTNNATLGNFGLQSFAANGTSGAYLYGAQIETSAAYATSYIPTLGASVTRGADAASKTGISSLIGQTQGTLFVDVNITKLVDSEAIGTINSGGYANNTTIARVNSGIQFVRNSATQSGASIITSSAIATGRHKIAIAYKSGDTAFFLDGVQVSTTQTETFTNGTLSVLAITGDAIGAIPFSDSYNQALLFPTRLTNAQMQELTSL